jgi:two-component system phosphate regulon response regulator OmpR
MTMEAMQGSIQEDQRESAARREEARRDALLPDDAAHILVVDDDKRICALLGQYLRDNGFRVTTAENAAAARASMRGLAYDLMILDIMMPGESGLSLAKSLRADSSSVPILMLTARAEPENRIRGLEIGVDDYLAKPFEPRELLLRLNNILRRRETPAPAAPAPSDEVRIGPYSFHMGRGELRRGAEAIKLTERERDLLRHFVQNAGSPLQREDLARFAGLDSERSVDVQINRLRQKIEADPGNPVYLQTVRGRGYILYVG